MTNEFLEKFPSLKEKEVCGYLIDSDVCMAQKDIDGKCKAQTIHKHASPSWFYSEKDILLNCLDKSKVREIIEAERLAAKEKWFEDTTPAEDKDSYRAKEFLCELLLQKLGLGK